MGQILMAADFDNQEVAIRLREEIARRRISRQGLAETARLSISTLEKALSGRRRFTLATVVRLEEALGASLREPVKEEALTPAPAAIPGLAPVEMGSYSRPAVQWIEGKYTTIRPSFGDPTGMYAYSTEICWNDDLGHLNFYESERVDADYSQTGFVSMPHISGQVYLVTSEEGQYRMLVLGRATRDGRMYGLLTTLVVGAGSQLVPTSCPIALVPQDQLPDSEFGKIEQGNICFDDYRAILDTATGSDFCRVIG